MARKTFYAFLLLACTSVSSDAALVVATCGTVPVTYTAGQIRQLTVDTNGNVCS